MIKRKVNFLILLALGLLCVTSSIVSIIKDINIDLQEAKHIIGQVTYADTRSIENITIRRTSYKRVFYFTLNNSKEKFAIHRSDEVYEDLDSNIKLGATVKVFYRPSVREYNIYVFHVEKESKVLVSYNDYNKQVSTKAGILLLIGILLSTGSIMWYKKFNLIKFMTGLVDGRPDKQQPTKRLQKHG
jgi:hypothetical protein